MNLLSLSWMLLISFIVYDNKFVVFPNFVIDCYRKLKLARMLATSVISTFNSFTTEQIISIFSDQHTIIFSPVPQHVITGVGMNVMSGAFFLKSSIATDSFWKIIIPLANEMTTLGQSTWIVSQTLSKACTNHVTHISLEQLTESPAAFIMYSMVPITSNMSNSICLQSLHNFTENMCYCCMIHCRHFLAWQRKWLPCLLFLRPQ